MTEFLAYFFGYQTNIVEKLCRHPNQVEILNNCSESRPLDDIIAFLCQQLGLPPNTWSPYTAALTAYGAPGRQISLSKLDTRIANFSHRFGTVIVLANPRMATALQTYFRIAITTLTEFELFKRRVHSIRLYHNANNAMVVGLVENKEVAVVLKNGEVTNLSINSAPLIRPDIIFVVGTLAQNQLSILPKHKTASDTFIGRDLSQIAIIAEHHTLTPTVLLFGVDTGQGIVDTARWNSITDGTGFTLITKTKVQFYTQHGECLESAAVETTADFLLRREV